MSARYGDLISSVRKQAHLIGNDPFTDDDLFVLLKESLGDTFVGVTYLQERFWSEESNVTVVDLAIAKPHNLFKVVAITGLSADGEPVLIDKEAKYSEVKIEQSQDEPLYLYAFRGENIVVSVDVPTDALLIFVRDPVTEASTSADVIDVPDSLLGLIVQRAIAKAEAHRDATKTEVLLRDCGYTMQRMKQAIETNENKDRKRVNAHYDGNRDDSRTYAVRTFDA